MTSRPSYVNSYSGNIAADSSFTGMFDDTSGYNYVRLWVTTPLGSEVIVNFATDPLGSNLLTQQYNIFGQNANAFSLLAAERYAQIIIYNPQPTTQSNVSLVTKFGTITPHPFLTYYTDNIQTNVAVDLNGLNVDNQIDFSTSSITVYGTGPDTCGHPIQTDLSGNLYVTPTVSGTAISAVNPLPVLIQNVTLDVSGLIYVIPTVSGAAVSIANPLPDEIVVSGSVVAMANPLPSSLVVSGSVVAMANPLPSSLVVSGSVVAMANPLPSSLVVSGSIISYTNPIPTMSILNGAAVAVGNPVSTQLVTSGAVISATNPLPAGLVIGGNSVNIGNPLPTTMASATSKYNFISSLPDSSAGPTLAAVTALLYSLNFSNNTASYWYLQVWDTATAPATNSAPTLAFGVSPTVGARDIHWSPGLNILNGNLYVAVADNPTNGGSTTPPANSLSLTLSYK